MMSRLRSRTPLTRRAPLRRYRPLTASRRAAPGRRGPGQLTREAVWERDGGRCVVCGAIGVHLHHRKPRGRGGVHDVVNLVSVCAGCHQRIHAFPAGASDRGYLLSAAADPAAVPLLCPSRGLVYLTCDAQVIPAGIATATQIAEVR